MPRHFQGPRTNLKHPPPRCTRLAGPRGESGPAHPSGAVTRPGAQDGRPPPGPPGRAGSAHGPPGQWRGKRVSKFKDGLAHLKLKNLLNQGAPVSRG